MANSSRYRYINWYGGRILESRELLTFESILRGVDSTGHPVAFDVDALYRPGATMNIKANISGTTVTLGPVNSSLPMLLFVRGRWETIYNSDITPVTLAAGQTNLYLNYVIRQVTSAEDPTLVDTTTGQPTADMGELDITFSATDNSGVALASNQFDKNTSPIIVFQFTNVSGVLTLVPLDNVNSPALASKTISGLVHLSTSTSGGEALSSDDPAVTNGRQPLAGSVVDASVRVPVATTGQNSDGSNKYDLTVDAGGISADKIIWQEVTERLSDFLAWIKAQVLSVSTALSNHIGQRLGLANTHPMPTATDVGAAPLSHVNLPLGVSGSHPAQVNSDSGGFVVNQSTGNFPSSPAFEVAQNGTQIAAVQHNGDFQSSFFESISLQPGGSPITFSGPIRTVFEALQALRDHVNQNTHGNPHGLTASDLNAATTSYVDNSVANAIQTVENYVNGLFSSNHAQNGYMKLPGGIIFQWGFAQGPSTVTFPIPFPNQCLNVNATEVYASGNSHYPAIGSGSVNTRSFFLAISDNASQSAYWFAVGF